MRGQAKQILDTYTTDDILYNDIEEQSLVNVDADAANLIPLRCDDGLISALNLKSIKLYYPKVSQLITLTPHIALHHTAAHHISPTRIPLHTIYRSPRILTPHISFIMA